MTSWIERGEILYVRRSISANTGVAPVCATELAVAIKEKDGTITSSPLFISEAFKGQE